MAKKRKSKLKKGKEQTPDVQIISVSEPQKNTSHKPKSGQPQLLEYKFGLAKTIEKTANKSPKKQIGLNQSSTSNLTHNANLIQDYRPQVHNNNNSQTHNNNNHNNNNSQTHNNNHTAKSKKNEEKGASSTKLSSLFVPQDLSLNQITLINRRNYDPQEKWNNGRCVICNQKAAPAIAHSQCLKAKRRALRTHLSEPPLENLTHWPQIMPCEEEWLRNSFREERFASFFHLKENADPCVFCTQDDHGHSYCPHNPCLRCFEFGHLQKFCPHSSLCQFCGFLGNHKPICPFAAPPIDPQIKKKAEKVFESPSCYNCGRSGHLGISCPYSTFISCKMSNGC